MMIARDFKVPYHVNSLGFRERELDLERLSTERPYFFVGDSYFNGWGVAVESRVTEKLSCRLAVHRIDVPVVNFSNPGYGTYQYLDVLKRYAAKINPRMVIIGFFVGNDFLDDFNTVKFPKRGLMQTDGVAGPYSYKVKTILRKALNFSSLVNFLKYSLWENRLFRIVFDKLELENDRIDLYKRVNTPLKNDLYQSTFGAFSNIARFSHEMRMPVLVVIIPDHLQVLRPDLFVRYEFRQPQRILKQRLNEMGLSYFDLLEEFLKENNPRLFFFPEDKHWNERGHQFVAEILFKVLVSQ